MSRLFTCPSCKKRVDLHEIHNAVMDLNGPPDWWCSRCKQPSPREAWGKSNDGVPAESYFLYGGPAKRESFWHKLPRAMVRGATFGGEKKLKELLAPMPDDPDMKGGGTCTQVAIYHRAERFSLRGRYFLPVAPNPRKVVLLLSGSGDTAHTYLSQVARRYCKRLNVAVLLMDYRGFGASDPKSPSEAGLFVDAEAMFRFLTDDTCVGGLGWSPKDVVIHGFSLGTGVAAELAARHRHAAGLVLQCPFTSGADMARDVGAKVHAKIGAAAHAVSTKGTTFEVLGKIPGISRPILLLIADGDTGMKDHGDAIADKQFPNVTVARYVGQHKEPHNAFKDGRKQPYGISDQTGPMGQTLYTPRLYNTPDNGDYVVQDRSKPFGPGNRKQFGGVTGCIADISQWFATL